MKLCKFQVLELLHPQKKKKNHTKEAIILNIIPESDHSAGMKKNGLCNLRRPFSSHE